MTEAQKADEQRRAVREAYSRVADSQNNADTSCCCNCGDPAEYAGTLGYTSEDLASLPEGANMGLSCGNPNAVAELQKGEVVLDLGSGGGFDVFVAARTVGAEGRAIGVDMTPTMVEKARNNARQFAETVGYENVEFRLGEMEHLPVADSSVDVVISNCVINLSPEKPQVWSEIARVLKPCGRVSVSDMALVKPLPQAVKEDVQALTGCISGAVTVEEYEKHITDVGLKVVELKKFKGAADLWNDMKDPVYRSIHEKLPEGETLSDYVVSMEIRAVKSHKASGCC